MSNRTNRQVNIEIGKKLQKARKSRKMTQAELASIVGISKNHLSAVERGVSKASIELLSGYCKALSMSSKDILGF